MPSPVTVTPERTVGISPKVTLPVGAQLVALIVNLIASGQFDRVEVAQLVGVALTLVLGWAAPIGRVCVDALSDAILAKIERIRARP